MAMVANFIMRGLEDLYLQNPLNDSSNPTAYEIEIWFMHVINHFRVLVGLTDMITLDQELFIKAKWSTERQLNDHWDHYSGTLDSVDGPCAGQSYSLWRIFCSNGY